MTSATARPTPTPIPTARCASSAAPVSPSATRATSPQRREASARLREELALIAHHRLSGFFLLHEEVLGLAREVALEVRGRDAARHVLPPGRGRGSSVGSIVCYLTGLSHVDPVAARLSLGRFLNQELASVPDIDLDFPRDIRERLIVRVHERYGPRQAALVGAFATYRARGAIRELGKALGLPPSDIARLATSSDGWNAAAVGEELRRLPGVAERAGDLRFRALDALAREIAGLPRHLSQHPGGMVISDRPLDRLVPLQPAAMAGRTICQWDKDSCADAGFLKIDLLGLGMLSAIESCVTELSRATGEHLDLSRISLDDREVYAEIQAADTVGVFQIESRAQMQMLLRTRPQCLDDLVVEVALVRPGPIQGGAVHPYLQRLQALRDDPSFPVPYDHPLLEEPLRETLGVIVFQDQVLDVAQSLAGFTAGQAETLRRAMSRRRSRAAMEAQWHAFRDGAADRGVPEHTARQVFDKVLAFSAFGFPKAHAAAFALLAYQSAWLRRHRPAAFLCSLLNAQPMGFYPPASLVRDAERRDIEVRHPDLHRSHVEARLEDGAVRVGLAAIKGLGEEGAAAVVREREERGPFASVRDLARRLELSQDRLEGLVGSGACDELGARRRLLWELGLAMRSAPARGRRPPALARPARGRGAGAARARRLGAARGRLRARGAVGARAPDRPHPPGARRRRLQPRPVRAADGIAHRAARPGHRPPAAGQRQGHRVPAAGGRVRPRQPDPDARRLRAAAAARAHRAVPADGGRAGAARPQRQRQGGAALAPRRARPPHAGGPPRAARRGAGRPARGRPPPPALRPGPAAMRARMPRELERYRQCPPAWPAA